ncbi:MAG: Smr/MutS family protein [Pseudomonadota bacterium]
MRKRVLRSHEKALWEKVARSIVPLRQTPQSADPKPKPAPQEPPPKPPAAAAKPQSPPKQPAADGTPAARGLGEIDKKAKRKLAKGFDSIDARIDLHGMTQDRAHEALSRFIVGSAARGCRTVLVITGKGRGGEGSGVLRRSVPVWLERRDLARHIVGIGQAGMGHGGSGALYVRLRNPARSRKRHTG